MDRQQAIQKAFENFEEWNETTGFVQDGTQSMAEIQSIITDAVHFGFQAGSQSATPTDYNLLEKIEEHFGKGCADICRERMRQQEDEGFSAEHDDQHTAQELARAAACYANPFDRLISRFGIKLRISREIWWPWTWTHEWWKPETTGQEDTTTQEYADGRQRELSKAGALIAADKDRFYRKSDN